MRTRVDIEAEMEAIRNESRRNPHMRLYHDALRDKLRQELRATMEEKDNSVFYFVSGIFLVLAAIAGIATYST